MPKLVVVVTTQTEKALELAEAWQEAGASGVTLIPSHGLRSLKAKTRGLELGHFVNLATILQQVEDTTQMLFSVVDDRLVDGLIRATRTVLGGALMPQTGIGFVVDVDRIFGTEP
jgi:orotidine-5'-phosphate decarboxylase